MPVKLSSTGGGSVTLDTPSTASNYTVTLPTANTTLADTSSTQTLTNKTLTAAGSNTVEATSGPTSSQLAGQRNKIINGAMMIDQRNAGAAVTVNGFTVYPVDRFYGSFRPSTGTATAQQVSSAPSNFVYSLKLTQASVTSLATSDYYGVIQKIEGYNFADMNFGSANAKTFTLSFWVQSSVTGTYGLSFQNVNATRRSYVTTYTVNAANTWEQKTITVAGDTSGTWEITNSSGLVIQWDLGSGSDYQTSTLNSWQTNNVVQASGATRWIATSGATFYITGVQLEKGATATPFENRLYGTELALCQRYFELAQYLFGAAAQVTGTLIYGSTPFKVTKRATPTIVFSGTVTLQGIITGLTPSSVSVTAEALNWSVPYSAATGTGYLVFGPTNMQVSSEL